MEKITMYSTQLCTYCRRAEQLLERKGITKIVKIEIDRNPVEFETMIARTGRRSVPQIFIGDLHVGGYDDLSALDRNGQLDKLLQQ